MGALITLFVAIIIFVLLWWLISLIPVPAGMPYLLTILRIVLILFAIVWLLTWFAPGMGMSFHPMHGS